MIRFAEKKDIDDIMQFIDMYWKKDHILARDKDFFIYQYCVDGEVGFVISRNAEEEINGVLGYIVYGEKKEHIMLALWKVVNPDVPMLGLKLLKFLMENSGATVIAAPGINMGTTKALYEYLGFKVGRMNHWYRLGEQDDCVIAKINNKTKPDVIHRKDVWVKEMSSFDQLVKLFDYNIYKESNPIPYKEEWYVRKRYFEHPIYEYRVFGVGEKDGSCEMFFVLRHEPCNGGIALRLVDVVGNIEYIKYVTGYLDELMAETNAEYVDIYEVGVLKDNLLEAGWLPVESSGNIIPNYFAPYVQENIDIFYSTTNEDIVLFKADGDQDRPS